MKTQVIVCLIFGLSPYFLTAQNDEQEPDPVPVTYTASAKKESKLQNLIEYIVDLSHEERSDQPVVLYSKPGFRGERLRLRNNWSANRSGSYWNDEIASIEVPRGLEVWLYEHSDFNGNYLVVTGNWSVRDNPRWRNRISSVRIVDSFQQHEHQQRRHRHEQDHRYGSYGEPGVSVYEHHDFEGASKTIFDSWSMRNSDDFWDDRISSINIPYGYVVVLYKHARFRGNCLTLEGPSLIQLDEDSWNDKVSSIQVFRR